MLHVRVIRQNTADLFAGSNLSQPVKNPGLAWHLNMQGLLNVLDISRRKMHRVYWPSSIAVFGPASPKQGVRSKLLSSRSRCMASVNMPASSGAIIITGGLALILEACVIPVLFLISHAAVVPPTTQLKFL